MKKILILLLSLLGMNACMNAQENNFTDMDVEHFAQYITNGDVQLVDVRTPEEYAEGDIEGARNIDVFDDDFLEEAQKSLDKSRPVPYIAGAANGRQTRRESSPPMVSK